MRFIVVAGQRESWRPDGDASTGGTKSIGIGCGEFFFLAEGDGAAWEPEEKIQKRKLGQEEKPERFSMAGRSDCFRYLAASRLSRSILFSIVLSTKIGTRCHPGFPVSW
jgi:hypothetical protein